MPTLSDMTTNTVIAMIQGRGFTKRFWRDYRSSAAKGSNVGKALDALQKLGAGIDGVLPELDLEKKKETLAAYDYLSKALTKAKSKCDKKRQKHTIMFVEEYERVLSRIVKAAKEQFTKLEQEASKLEKAEKETKSQSEKLEKLGDALNRLLDFISTANKDLAANEDWFFKAQKVYIDGLNKNGFRESDAEAVLRNFEAGASRFKLDQWHEQTTKTLPKAVKEAAKLLPKKADESLKTLRDNLSDNLKTVTKELMFASNKAQSLQEMQDDVEQRVKSDREEAASKT